jgi:hypothetical protein
VSVAKFNRGSTQGFTNFAKCEVAGSDLMFNAGVVCKQSMELLALHSQGISVKLISIANQNFTHTKKTV